MRIAVVLDATAVLAYAAGNAGVGEILSEILDAREDGDQLCAALPAMSLLAAVDAKNVTDVRRLAAHAAIQVVSTRHDHALLVAGVAAAGNLPGETAAAAWQALHDGAQLLTARGEQIRSASDEIFADLVIDIIDSH